MKRTFTYPIHHEMAGMTNPVFPKATAVFQSGDHAFKADT